jgi:flagellar hook protein FlgE
MAISDPNGGTLGTPAGTMNIVFDPTTGGIDKTATQAANAADMAVDSDGNLKIGDLTQYNSDYSVGFVDQNGAELGLRTGVSIDRNGYVVSSFSNGQTRNLYKLPVATFTNPNGLQERTGNVYIQSIESGSYNLREAGSSGAGTIAASSLENSNVDLADEFSRMIITQRAYSAGTKVISTSDQMLQELLQLR